MNILVAPDSFKGSLTSLQAANIMKEAILSIHPNDLVKIKPMADGGEGTVDVLLSSTNGKRIPITCTGPQGKKINTYYGILDDNVAVIEVANIAGLVQVLDGERNPDYTTSYGLGEVMLDAIGKGCTTIVIGLGGSATNDGGFGMLQALGMKAWNQSGSDAGIFGKDLQMVDQVSFENLDPRLKDVKINVACDVNNPLCGPDGATEIYGRQKGASEQQVKIYDKTLEHYSKIVESKINPNGIRAAHNVPGSGAAGGLGFALLVLGAQLVSGAELIANVSKTEEEIKQSDLVITGEGQSDQQTLFGKAPGYIADIAKKYDVPTILLSGSLAGDINLLRNKFAGCFSIINQPLSLNECIDDAENLLFEQTKHIIHFVHSFHNH